MAKVFVVAPTYNEKGNLPVLAGKIFDLRIKGLELIVVDDNSPDGTGQIAEELAKKQPIRVIHRDKKEGLGVAYASTFKKLLEENFEYVIQMDADLSHNPAVIPKMLEKINPSTDSGQEECDLVLGSRYIKDGEIENWDFFRKMVSKFGNIYARLILALPYRDLTGGYKCFRKKVLEGIDLDSLDSTGYNFQIETTYKAHKKKFKICEIPITFTERKIGKSKFNLGIIIESFWKVLLLRFKK